MENKHCITDASVSESTSIIHDSNNTLNPMDCSTNIFFSGKEAGEQHEDANVHYFCRTEVVRCNEDSSRIGFVTNWYMFSECIGGGDGGGDSGNGDNNDNGIPKESDRESFHHQPIIWIDGSKTTHKLHDVTVVDKSFFPGDFVTAALDPKGQMGTVMNVNVYVDLLAADGSIIKDVSSKELKGVRDFASDDYVVLGPWVGRVKDCSENVTVLFDDGEVCQVMDADDWELEPVSKNIDEYGDFTYYPGQRVRTTSLSDFKKVGWLSGLWNPSRLDSLEGTVTKVTVGSVYVDWIACSGHGSETSTVPDEEQSSDNLKLSRLVHKSWKLGDWCLLPWPLLPSVMSAEKDISRSKADDPTESGLVSAPVHENWPVEKSRFWMWLGEMMRHGKKAKKKEENFERALMIVNIKTRVDVAWQDGTTELGLDSTSLIYTVGFGFHDFFPEQYVVDKASNDGDGACEVQRIGVVKSVTKERTAFVRWLKQVARPEDDHEFDKEEMVSVYELENHPDYDYRYGNVVVQLPTVSVSAHTVDDISNQETSHLSDLSWVGKITGLKDGYIEVTTADGMVSKVGPDAIYVITNSKKLNENSEEIDQMNLSFLLAMSPFSRDFFSWGRKKIAPSSLNSMVESWWVVWNLMLDKDELLQFFNRLSLVLSFLLDSFHCFLSRRSWVGCFPNKSEAELHGMINVSEKREAGDESNSQESNEMHDYGEQTTDENAEEDDIICKLSPQEPDNHSAIACLVEDLCSFKRFDISKDPLDHYFLGVKKQNDNGRKWLKKIQQDWSILQNNLPDGICVRVYEDRIDLLRAVIVGAYGTPYQDGLFVFDFHFPPAYPHVPPLVYYHSGGWSINPNLDNEGNVCLSILNTTTGTRNEVWNPLSSSTLQVLVSLQGLVLNSKPYFNEAAFNKQVGTAEGEKNSLSYNENTFLLNCKLMMYHMQKPPKDFEELVKDHFRRRGYYILKACDAYMKGYSIGSLTKDASITDESNEHSNSAGFKLMMVKIVPKLILALSEVGADCQKFKHLQES